MHPADSLMPRAARWLTFASAASIMLSIMASQVLLGLALAALLLSGQKLRLPPIKLPLAIFMLLTLAAWALSPDPWSDGFPQIRKFYVFCTLLVVFSTFRDMAIVRWLFLTWAGIGGVSALRGFVQFADTMKLARHAGVDFYSYYVGDRITGFSSHWNTYAAEEMFAFVMLGALLFFGVTIRRRRVWVLCATMIAAALYLGETRAVWIATAAASLYLVWFWKPRLLLCAPLVAVVAFAISPPVMRERFTSILQPKRVDSNQFRLIAWNAGIQMIERHPVFGLGPDGPKYHFAEYVPAGTWSSRPPGFYEHLHNLYLQYGAERGIPTLLVFLWLMIRIVVDFWRGLRALPPGRSDRRYLLRGGIAMVLAIMAEGIADVNLGTSVVLTMFLVVVACGYLALEKRIQETP
jgi:putative inorganic carbon (HCO3(-)) transporter